MPRAFSLFAFCPLIAADQLILGASSALFFSPPDDDNKSRLCGDALSAHLDVLIRQTAIKSPCVKSS